MYRSPPIGKVWVYTQKGVDHYNKKWKGIREERKAGQVAVGFEDFCPKSWVENGWVEEGGNTHE